MSSVVIVLGLLLIMLLAISFGLFLFIFYVPPRRQKDIGKLDLPPGKIYEPFHEKMKYWSKVCRNTPHEVCHIRSHDGLNLYGKFYEFAPGAPIEILFHGYRGHANREMSGAVRRCHSLGHSALIVHQRACGKSGGHVITFGVNEHKDCLKWIEFMLQRFGCDVKIILTGISMGASTVLMAAGTELPENVIGVLSDCGFTSARDIMKVVIRQMGLPADLSYPFVRLGAKIFGHFDLEEITPLEAVTRCKIPVIFFHGEADDFVPCEMSRRNFEACASRKQLVTIAGAGHGLSYPVDESGYITALKEFFGPDASATSFSIPHGG